MCGRDARAARPVQVGLLLLVHYSYRYYSLCVEVSAVSAASDRSVEGRDDERAGRRDRDFYPTLLGESSQDYPAVEPHIMLSKVWNVLAERAEPGAVPVSGG